MASIFPTSIQQVQDNSNFAGGKLIDLLGKENAPNPWAVAYKVVDTAEKAKESQRLAEATDAFYRRMQNGQSINDSINGIDARIAGSSAFQKRADEIQNILRQDAEQKLREKNYQLDVDKWANLVAQQQRQLQASALTAEFLDYIKRVPDGAAIWVNNNRSRLQQNPDAYNSIMKLAGDDLSIVTEDSAPLISRAQLQTNVNLLQREKDKLSSRGIAGFSDPEQEFMLKSKENLVDTLIKKFGYTDGDALDFRDNFDAAYSKLDAAAREYEQASGGAVVIPEEAKLAALARTINTAPDISWMLGVGRFRQADFNTSDAVNWLKANGANFAKDREIGRQIMQKAKAYQGILDNNALEASEAAVQSSLAKAKAAGMSRSDLAIYQRNLRAKQQAQIAALMRNIMSESSSGTQNTSTQTK